MQVKVTFYYEVIGAPIQVQCSSNDTMVDLFQKFISKAHLKSDINNYEYYYNNNVLSHESTIDKAFKFNPNDEALKKTPLEIFIKVEKKTRICKCPTCKCNDCIINLINYQLAFYGCKYDKELKHKEVTVYDNFSNKQKIDYKELRCHTSGCSKTLQNEKYDFYKCLSCTKLNNGTGKYYCQDCISNHQSCKYVKYDEKIYYCGEHFEPFEKCCFTCKKDLCKFCEDYHTEHKIASYNEMTINIEDLKHSLGTIKNHILTLDKVIESIKYNLDGTKRIYDRYYKIANNILNIFETFNKKLKNYKILRTIRNLTISNKQIIDDLNKIIEEKDLPTKSLLIIETYINKEKFYKGIENTSTNSIEKENDEKWFEEIQNIKSKKKEQEKEKENQAENKRKKKKDIKNNK